MRCLERFSPGAWCESIQPRDCLNSLLKISAPSEYSPGFEVSHIRTRLESLPKEEAESDGTNGKQGEAHIHRHTEKPPSTEEDDVLLGFYLRLKRIEASLDPQSESEGSDEEEESESDAGG
jgi:hypothetical protein